MNSASLDNIPALLHFLLGDGIVIKYFCLEHYDKEKHKKYNLEDKPHLVLNLLSEDTQGNRFVEIIAPFEHGTIEQPLNVELPLGMLFM